MIPPVMKRRRWLIIAPTFNCDGRAASQTITDKLPYLEDAGIDMEVISSVTGERHSRIAHHQVWPLGPSGIRFDYRHVTSKRYGRGFRYKIQTVALSIVLAPAILVERILTGLSGHWSWTPAAAIKAWSLNRAQPFDLIFSSGGPVSAHLAGWMAHKLTGLPWIAEVHDPIVNRRDPKENKLRARLSRERWIERVLEKLVCDDAQVAWWFTDAAVAAARGRNPQLGERGLSLLPGAKQPEVNVSHQYCDVLRIGHFGVLSDSRSLAEFLEGLYIWINRNPSARSVVQLHVFGTGLDPRAKQVAEVRNMWDMIVSHGRLERDPITGESGRTQVTRKMQECDALLLLHGNVPWCAEYIPSKIYEYIWARRPILALTHQNSQLDDLVQRYGGVIANSLDANSVAAAMDVVWSKWKSQSLDSSSVAPVGVDSAVATIMNRVDCALQSSDSYRVA